MITSDKLLKYFPISIPVITCYGYLAGFLYEFGACYYYGIPISLINVSIGTILSIVGGISVGIGVLFVVVIPLVIFASTRFEKRPMTAIWIKYNIMFLLLILIFLPASNLDMEAFGTCLSAWVALNILINLKTSLTFSDKRKFITTQREFPKWKHHVLAMIWEQRIIKKFTSAKALIFYAITFLFVIPGGTEYVNRIYNDYYLLKGTDYVLVKRYDNNYIFKRIDTVNNKFLDSIIVMQATSDKTLSLVHMNNHSGFIK
ncbi:hypothetical protein [Mucilaginibacter sp. UYCu711]|uniref:hypothetical protein n=1 Tax=Mucilaginibacter sp. UYCu711 TaxID=3156339 RepID=UPI003D1F2188